MNFVFPFLLALFGLPALAITPSKWEKVETKENVEVYKGQIEESDVVAFRGVSIIAAPLSHVLSVIYDVSRIKEWMSDVKTVKVLERTSKFEKIEYSRTEAPWPLSDRDFVYATKVNLNRAEKTVEILIESTEHKDAPPIQGVVRGHLHLSRYFLKSLDAGEKTHLEVEILADPKGSLPKWVINMFQGKWPVNTVNGIRKIASEENFKVHPDVAESIAGMDN